MAQASSCSKSSLPVREVRRWWFLSCASLSAVVVDAPQGMECDASSRSVGPGVTGSEPTSGGVAQGTQAAASRTTTFEARTDRHSVSDEGEQLGGGIGSVGARRSGREGRGQFGFETREARKSCRKLGSGHQKLSQRWRNTKVQRS